ncbi:MAG: AAA family ATPase [Eubacteriales bacterium]|nr:AAA family ATPase [Eubacteriales bacterium]
MTGTKKLPIGIENFQKIRTEGFYYIDKTNLITELINNWGEVNLFTRPRRFGKSLNMSMLKAFFEIGCNKALFDDLEISKETKICEEYMGQFPVISISLKGVSGDSFETARAMMCAAIGREALRFQFLLESRRLTDVEKSLYKQLIRIENQSFIMSDSDLVNSLLTLSSLLQKEYDHKVIILIDEYDVPLDKAHRYHYYDSMVMLMRNLFNQGLKSNDSLYFAVLTGCLRISKESIFTGLNNPKVLSITDVRFEEYFGFTDKEVQELLSYYNLEKNYELIKEWYDGYRFGSIDVYCPWDVICYCDTLRANNVAKPEDYWSNTSDNAVVRQFIQMANKSSTKREIEKLIAGEMIEKEIHQELTYKDYDKSVENLWSILFTTGYLTSYGIPEGDIYKLRLPNLEIRKIFTRQIYTVFQENALQDGQTLNDFCEGFKNGDVEKIELQLNAYLRKTISIRDTFVKKQRKENFYHGILLGLLAYKENWDVTSNRESGDGFSDILIEIEDENIGIVIEVKYPDGEDLNIGCRDALRQIEERHYEEQLLEDGMNTILKYGIACNKKQCKVLRG